MRRMTGGALALAMLIGFTVPAAGSGAEEAPKSESKSASASAAAADANAKMRAFEATLHPMRGDVRIPDAKAVLHLGKDYYFLPPADAKRVLVEAWGNPPQAAQGVLGMVLLEGTTVFDNVWGAVLTYEDTGHITDADAEKQDYAAVLKDMQDGTEQANPERTKAGYPAMHLVGWAQAPYYDKARKALIWAREMKIEGAPANELNYDVRLLGRTGVLSMNMLASMQSLGQVREAAQRFGQSVTFEPGAGYADFRQGDKVAEYGLAGLVAGGAAVAVAKKVGILAILLKFGKFILIGLVALGGTIMAFLRRLTGRREDEDGDGTI